MGSKRGNGEGSIRQLRSGNYRAEVMIAGRRHSVSAPTKRDAQRKLRELLVNADKGIVPARERLTLGDFAARWLADVARHNVRPATYKSYCDLMRLYVLPTLGGVQVARLTPEHVQRLYGDLLEHGRLVDGRPSGRPLSPKSVKNVHLCLHAALEQAVKWNLAPRNVASIADPPRVKRHEVQALSAEQVRTMLATAGGTRLGVLVNLAVNTGMRQGELLGLRWRDVDLERGELRVRYQYGRDGLLAEPKSARSRRTIELPAGTVAALREHRTRQLEERLIRGPLREDRDFVLCTATPYPERDGREQLPAGRPLEHRNVERDFTALLDRAGLPRVPFHALRHTHAMLLLAAGTPVADVSARLGHSSAAMTLDVYGHVLPDAGRGIAARLDALLA